MMFRSILAVLALSFFFSSGRGQENSETLSIDISGEWQFCLDPEDQGEAGSWWNRDLPYVIHLPGSVQEQGFGTDLAPDLNYMGKSPSMDIWRNSTLFAPYRDSGRVKLSWALNPPKYYQGAAWFRKKVYIPENLKDRRLRIFLERSHWVSDLWVDGDHAGKQTSLSVPHEYDLAPLDPGEHHLTLRVDNRMYRDVGPNAQSISDQTQTNWNGVIGRMEIRVIPDVEIIDLQVYPDPGKNEIRISSKLRSVVYPDGRGKALIRIRGLDDGVSIPVEWSRGEGSLEAVLRPESPLAAWDEFSPVLHELEVEIVSGGICLDRAHKRFGMRKVAVSGSSFTVNGNPVFIRGTLQNAQYPETGYPPMDVESWRREIRQAQSYGLNHYRFHSWCPPEAAFIAADELGFYLQPEGPAWPVVDKGTEIAAYMDEETLRILEHYGSHPSFMMFACGNEFGGDNGGLQYMPDSLLPYQALPPAPVQQCLGAAYLGDWVPMAKERSGGRQFVTSSGGWPYIRQNDFHIMHEPFRMRYVYNKLKPGTTLHYGNLVESHDRPLVSHETGQWCAYPSFREIASYTGYLKPANLEIFRDFAEKNGILTLAESYHRASGKFQALLYKQELEALFRTPGAAGFQILGLLDYHGHGFAPVGVVNALFEPKAYVSAGEFRRFCSEVVLLAEMEKRAWTSDERFSAMVRVADFAPGDWQSADLEWTVRTRENGILHKGRVKHGDSISFGLKEFSKACKLNLEICSGGSEYCNDWDFWVYPEKLPQLAEEDFVIVRSLDPSAHRAISEGKKILLVPREGECNAVNPGQFESIFWSTWSGTGTLGILCRNDHPALGDFPSETHSNWQWWELLRTSLPLDLTGTSYEGEVIVEQIDNWVRARRLGLLFECRIGESRIMVCAMDVLEDPDNRPVARQMKHSLLNYMSSEAFAPEQELSLEDLEDILGSRDGGLEAGGALAMGKPEYPAHPASRVLDGDPHTYWEAGMLPGESYELIIELPAYQKAGGFRLRPFRPGADQPMASCSVYFSHDGSEWHDPIWKGIYPPVGQNELEHMLDKPAQVRFVRILFTGRDPGAAAPYVSLAEFEFIGP